MLLVSGSAGAHAGRWTYSHLHWSHYHLHAIPVPTSGPKHNHLLRLPQKPRHARQLAPRRRWHPAPEPSVGAGCSFTHTSPCLTAHW